MDIDNLTNNFDNCTIKTEYQQLKHNYHHLIDVFNQDNITPTTININKIINQNLIKIKKYQNDIILNSKDETYNNLTTHGKIRIDMINKKINHILLTIDKNEHLTHCTQIKLLTKITKVYDLIIDLIDNNYIYNLEIKNDNIEINNIQNDNLQILETITYITTNLQHMSIYNFNLNTYHNFLDWLMNILFVEL